MSTAAESPYTPGFYAYHGEVSRRSAQRVLPLATHFTRPKSVLDVGCGIGTWLAEVGGSGVQDCLGVDGDYVDRAQLQIPPEHFQAVDLAQRFRVGRRFDMVMSLEVAEHLPESSADDFVASLTSHADVVLFSAAIPLQAGTGHVNMQWPAYWYEKFSQRGFEAVDCLRRPLWDDVQVGWYYRQNLLLYIKHAKLAGFPNIKPLMGRGLIGQPMPLVHPEWYLEVAMRDCQRRATRAPEQSH